jgi:hypothetical protein
VSQDTIAEADSLFNNKKYTEAYRIYEKIYNNGEASEAMLMKMSFIKEGLGDHVEAILFLNDYITLTKERKALEKIRDIAKENNLQGYNYSDLSFFIFQLSQYRLSLALLCLASGFLLILIAFRRKKQDRSFVPAYAFGLIFLILGTFINNKLFRKKEGVIVKSQTLFMEAPSAGSDLVDIAAKGHKIEILSSDELWYKVKWDNEIAYVRKSNIRPI